MRKRLAAAILLTVWTVLIAGGGALYWEIRGLLISDLDSLLYARATALPELLHPAGFDASRVPVYDWNDRYVIQQTDGGWGPTTRAPAVTGDAPATAPAAVPLPQLVGARFTRDLQGRR